MRKYFWKISLLLFIFTGVFSDFIANDKPIICKNSSGYFIPVLDKDFNYDKLKNCDTILNPPIKYSYKTIDTKNAGYMSPFSKQNLLSGQQRHFLGTDELGRDVLAGIIHGTGIALKTGFFSMFLALIIGLIFSLYPSYYGDYGKKTTYSIIISTIFIICIFLYYIANIYFLKHFSFWLIILLIIVTLIISIILYYLINLIPFLRKKVNIPFDTISDTFIKLFQSLPGSFLVLILISLFAKPALINIILVIAILKWPLIARYVRAEILKTREEKFIDASKVLRLNEHVIIWRHILPHIWTPVIVALSFGFAGTILLESTLSFLGIGIPADHVSWGTLLSGARSNYSAWWLAVFPGFAIFWIIYIFNQIGNSLQNK